MNEIKKAGLLIISGLIFTASSAQASCLDCIPVNGEKVYLQEVGTVLNDYDYVRLENGKKATIPYKMIPRMTIAMALGLPVYISQKNGNYTIINEN